MRYGAWGGHIRFALRCLDFLWYRVSLLESGGITWLSSFAFLFA
jgi:hypothetical protein